MFHDGMMRARVQLDDGDFSAWFNVCQGLRQGCVLSPLLYMGHRGSSFGYRCIAVTVCVFVCQVFFKEKSERT